MVAKVDCDESWPPSIHGLPADWLTGTVSNDPSCQQEEL